MPSYQLSDDGKQYVLDPRSVGMDFRHEDGTVNYKGLFDELRIERYVAASPYDRTKLVEESAKGANRLAVNVEELAESIRKEIMADLMKKGIFKNVLRKGPGRPKKGEIVLKGKELMAKLRENIEDELSKRTPRVPSGPVEVAPGVVVSRQSVPKGTAPVRGKE